MVEVIGQGEIAREIDFDAVAFPDSHCGQDVEKLVEDLCGGLRCTLRESLAHAVGGGHDKRTRGVGFRHGSESANGQRDSEDAEIVVVDLVSETGVTDLVEAFELIEADGIAVRHEHAMEEDGETCLAEGVHLLGFAQQL